VSCFVFCLCVRILWKRQKTTTFLVQHFFLALHTKVDLAALGLGLLLAADALSLVATGGLALGSLGLTG